MCYSVETKFSDGLVLRRMAWLKDELDLRDVFPRFQSSKKCGHSACWIYKTMAHIKERRTHAST
jgi:hypothetical protein